MIDSNKNNNRQQSVQQFLDRKTLSLRFNDTLESLFQNEYASKYREHMRIALLIASAIFLGSWIFDYYNYINWHVALLTRLSITGPVLLLLVILAYTPSFVHISQLIMSLSALFLAISVITIAYYFPPPFKTIYYDITILIEVYAFSLARIQFKKACIVAISIFIVFNITLFLDNDIHLELKLAHDFLFIAAAIFTLSNNYFMERSARKEFLQSQLLMMEKQDLQAANVKLADLASHDSLTKLANRRAFSLAIEVEWRRAFRQKYPLALMMIDLDFFKELNDRYGHQKGDECLQKIADVFAAQTRRPGDLAARYGGDEFILLFSGTDAKEAKVIAENINQIVSKLMIANEDSQVADILTLTIGIASLVPPPKSTVDDLLKQADNALYKGKVQGRNCVVVYE